jgi:hypothetical protein
MALRTLSFHPVEAGGPVGPAGGPLPTGLRQGPAGKWNGPYLWGAAAAAVAAVAGLFGFGLGLSARIPVYSYANYAQGIFIGLFGAVSAALAVRFWVLVRPASAAPSGGTTRWAAGASLCVAVLLATQSYAFARMFAAMRDAGSSGSPTSPVYSVFALVALCAAGGSVFAYLESVGLARGEPPRYRRMVDAGSGLYLVVALPVALFLVQDGLRMTGV